MTRIQNPRYALKSLLRSRKRSARLPHAAGRYADMMESELNRLIQKQVAAGLADIFGANRRKGAEEVSNSFGNAPPSFIPLQPGGLSQAHMEVLIDQMVASSLMHGRQTTGILRTLFGIVPSLIGR